MTIRPSSCARSSRRQSLWILRAATLAGLIVSSPAYAHHGKDFLSVESYELPHPEDVYGLASSAYERDGDEKSMELEPAVLLGIWPGLAAEVHAHFAKANGESSFQYEAIAPALRLQLTERDSASPVDVGLSVEYEIGAEDAPDAIEGRLILEKRVDRVKVSVNGIARRIRSIETEFGYAVGARFEVNEALGVGAEAQGSFESGFDEGLIGLFLRPTERFSVMCGAGTGPGGDNLAVRFGAVYRY